MKIKPKLTIGIGLLFAMIALLTFLSSWYINRLSDDTRNILVANYNTLDYSRNMLDALNNGIESADNLQSFQKNLKGQQVNITEIGEKELTEQLTTDFELFLEKKDSLNLQHKLERDLTSIMWLNMLTIQRKSNVAIETGKNGIFWIEVSGTLCFLIAFSLLVNLPGNIANPIQQLTASIIEIASANYSQRVHFETHNEFGDLAHAFNTMAEKLEEYKNSNIEKLLMEKKRIETLINNMKDPVIGLDENNLVLFMNKLAMGITGLANEDIVGRSIIDLSKRNDLLRSLIQKLPKTESGSIDNKSTPLKIYADNKESYFEQEIIPIKIIPTGENKEILIGSVIRLKNVTPYKELDYAKTNFIATVSHELKTPISSIKMGLSLLGNIRVGSLNEEQKFLVNCIQEDADQLLKLTGELLNFTQIETSAIPVNLEPTEAKEIVNAAINANKSAAEHKAVAISTTIEEGIPQLIADKDKTTLVLTNLISNAIRYSFEHSTVKIIVCKQNESVVFSVEDNGQGIRKEFLERIFERYFRIPGNQNEGTGLGLSICKEFIEAQGGSIGVESVFGTGSRFWFMMPV